MHLRAASSPSSTALKPPPARSESAKPTSKVTAGRRTSSLTSSELPRPSRRHSAQVASTRQPDKENSPVDKPATDNGTGGGGGLEKQEPAANVKIEKSTSSNSTKITAAARALKPKSSNVKAFQSTVSPLMHFDKPAPLPTALFSGLAISGHHGGVSPAQDSSSTTRSFSGPASLQHHTLSATNYAAQQPGYLSVPNSPAPFYNPAAAGFGVSPAVYNPAAAAAYYYPTDFSAFFHSQGYTVPSPPGTPLSTSTGAIPSSSGATTGRTTGNSNNYQQQQQLYPPSLGLGHPYWYPPATTTSSANTSLSLSSVAASSLGLSPANSRSTSASSVASAGVGTGNKIATATAATVVYPIPYGYSTPFVAAPAVPAPAPPPLHDEETTTICERLEGGAVLSSRGACKFFDVEKGFGFIIDDNAEELGADVFIHYTGIEQTRGFRCLAQQERVEYALVKHSSGRFQALKLRGEHGASLKGLDDPRQAAAFDRMNSKAAALWSKDEENVCPPGKGRHRRGGYAPAHYKGNMRGAPPPPPPRIRRTPAEDDEGEDDGEGDNCVEVEEE